MLTSEAAITQTVLACADLSATRTGALIIFERDNRLDDQIRTGTVINAETTAELLKNIFYPKAPLHDGAVIVRKGRIQAAGCMLPLSGNTNLSRELGMRHRAGIGMSEVSDARGGYRLGGNRVHFRSHGGYAQTSFVSGDL